MFQNKFLLFLNMFLFKLLLIYLLIVHVNLGHLHLLVHHRLVPLDQHSEVTLHVSKRLDHPTLSPFLVVLMQSQMLIQGELLLKKKLMNKKWQTLHMEKNQELTSKLWHHQMLLSGQLLSPMSLINSLASTLINLPICHIIDLALAVAGLQDQT
jgi:hypothetical protein